MKRTDNEKEVIVMRDEILMFFRQNEGKFISGQAMSEACNVSRTAIWKHIKVLRSRGYKIESYTRKGYRLLAEPDLVSPLEMEKRLTTKKFGRTYVYEERCISTNNVAKQLAYTGADEGSVVVTEEQSAGRGRLLRGWYSPYGKGLWFSLVLRPKFSPMEAPKFTLMAAVALTKAFHKMGLTEAGIKWPNDILVGDKKLVGILTEMDGTMESINYIIMGIGINVSTKKMDLPKELKKIATSFAIEGIHVDRRDVLNAVLQALEEQYEKVCKEGFGSTLEEWRKLSVTLEKEVSVQGPGEMYEGVAENIDDDGNLLVRRANGALERVIAGDVSIRPVAKK